MARAGMNPKTLQYLMGYSDIGVTMNTYTHLGLEDAQNEMVRLEELNRAKEEVAKAAGAYGQFLWTAGPHFPASQRHNKRTV